MAGRPDIRRWTGRGLRNYTLTPIMSEKGEAATRRVVLGTYQTVLDGITVPYTLKRGPRCRFARLEIARETGLTAVVPRRYDIKKLPAFFEANKRWIIRTLKKYSSRLAPEKILRWPENSVPYLGNFLEVVTGNNSPRASIGIAGNKLTVSPAVTGYAMLAGELEKWYRKEAARVIRGKVSAASARLGLSYNRVVIKKMKSRWGSCSSKRNLNFNWRLIMCPEPVIDYVIIHELSHLRQMNHSDKFWALVEKECPDWRERRRWLTKNGRDYIAASLIG